MNELLENMKYLVDNTACSLKLKQKIFLDMKEIEKILEENKKFSGFLNDYFVLEIDEFRVWIPKNRESELKELCKVFLKATK